MPSKKSATKAANQHHLVGPALLNREAPITPAQRLAVCYMNRAHDSLAGVPFAVWQELCEWQWNHPNSAACELPNMIGLKAPDAVPLFIDDLLREIDGEDRSRQAFYLTQDPPRIVWIYPKV